MKIRYQNSLLTIILIICLGLVMAAPSASAGDASAFQISSGDDLLSGDLASGLLSDYCLANDSVVVIISDIPHSGLGAVSGGNIIDAALAADRFDALGNLYTYFDDDWPRQADYNQISIHNSGADGQPAIIRVVGNDTDRPALVVVTDYILATDQKYVTLETTITNTGGQSYNNFELGDAFNWGGCDNFAPGYGFSLPGDSSQPWMAGAASEIAYGYTNESGNMWGPNGSYWSDINVEQASISSGGSVTYSRYFIVGGHDIASVVDVVHERHGAVVGSAYGWVTDGASNPIGGANIDAYDSGDNIYLRMITEADGWASATLQPGEWRLRASAPGFDAVETNLTILADETASYHFTLSAAGVPPVGDTLTVIQRPLLNIPAIVPGGETFTIDCEAPLSTTGWSASLIRGAHLISLEIVMAQFDSADEWWHLSARIPAESLLFDLYDLVVTADGGIADTTANAVSLIPAYKDEYYFAHITDSHLPTKLYSYQPGAEADSSEVQDLREVIADLEIINPEFVLFTGDIINEGEMEDYLYWRYYTRTQRWLTEFTVPFYMVAGNHDIGGWDDTPPPAGTARQTWWRFFGWQRLDDPPAGAPWHTQNYSFDYGPVHFTGLEAYDNYDSWRYEIYGDRSFTSGQLSWLEDDLAAASQSSSQVLFYHYDFLNQLDLEDLGVEMALWGHIHSDRGSLTEQPYDLATNNTCSGARAYRLIRVTGGVLAPQPTLSAGGSGENLQVSYTPSNDGTSSQVTATVINDQDSRFEFARLRLNLPAGTEPVEVVGGTLAQIDDSGPIRICYVNVDLLANSTQEVTAFVSASDVAGPHSAHLNLAHPQPNPFQASTLISYQLPDSAPVHLVILDPAGREVVQLIDEEQAAGLHQYQWQGLDQHGNGLPAGVYFIRLLSNETRLLRKVVLMR